MQISIIKVNYVIKIISLMCTNTCGKNLATMSILFYSLLLLSCNSNGKIVVPEVETRAIAEITHNSAISGGIIINDGGSEILAKGICWSTNSGPDTSDSHTVDSFGSNPFESQLIELKSATNYFVKAYATNNAGISYGNELSFKTSSAVNSQQIIADHTVVDRYDDIPQYYIDEVKKMWVVYAGESHTFGVMYGLRNLEAISAVYNVNHIESGTPEAFTASHLRASIAMWGDVNTSSGWIYGYGEEDWYKSTLAKSRTKAGLQYCHDIGPALSAIGFGFCWDWYTSDFAQYISATDEYIAYCALKGISTKVFFTTGTVDAMPNTNESYTDYLGYESIRAHVAADPSRILFDYADILCYDDGSESPSTCTYNGHVYPHITPTNLGAGNIGHIGYAGSVRLAKAMWWMLARIAGWDGN